MWKYKSSDCESISLHDNIIDEIFIENGNIRLVFNNGFDIVKTHPLNDTQKSKHTTKSQIILENACFIRGKIFYSEHEIKTIDLLAVLTEFKGFEVLEFQAKNHEFLLMGQIETQGIKHEYTELAFSYIDMTFCWNDYSADAWFEGCIISREKAINVMQEVLNGSLSRNDASNWAEKIYLDEDIEVFDEVLRDVLSCIMAIDLPTTDREFLYCDIDILAWIDRLMENS